ncbi:uncharacterized protein LOC136025833 isoform X2 [Artemia franciscana]|uniref:uncharacterized protein LOC136025833 isoform X2 n=1 Tax=Artemia franciscana TaxID=6661 RepID=UPI0032D9E5FC
MCNFELKCEGARTFVECGALDGLTYSTTLHLEYHLGWTGLLIEADPVNYKNLKQLKRKAITINACASPNPYPFMAKFSPSHRRQSGSKKSSRKNPEGADKDYNPGNGKVIVANQTGDRANLFEVLCLPMYTMLAASNLLNIDLFILDIEGLELDVLKTLPLEMLNIKVFVVETYNGNHKLENFKAFFEKSGYTFHGVFTGGMHPEDAIFVKKNFYNPEKLNATVIDFYKVVTGDWTLSKFNEDTLSLLKHYS